MSLVGIDLGTTYSAVAQLGPDGRPETVLNAEGELTTPSVVYFESAEDVIVGRLAKRALRTDPELVVQNIKRHIGDAHHRVTAHGKMYRPIDISALIMTKLKQDAEKLIGSITAAVVTVPAYFDERRRQDTAAAAEMAGLTVIDILNEPTAAALAHAYRHILADSRDVDDALRRLQAQTEPRHVVVYDLGGGTFDVTVLRRVGGDLTVLATAGDVELGGVDWNRRIIDEIAESFLAMHNIDPRHDRAAYERLNEAAEELKRDLSSRKRAPYQFYHAGHELAGELTREQFEQMTEDLLFRTESRVNRALRDAKLEWAGIDQVLAVGGSTRMPMVLKLLQRISGREPDVSLSPDEAVAHGAAIHAAIRLLTPATDKTGKDELAGQAMAVRERDSLILNLGHRIVALLRGLRTTNVNAHTLGVVASDRRGRQAVSPMIPRNSPLPIEATRCFGTIMENQNRVTVQIVEGEAQQPEACIPVGTCSIMQLPPNLPKGSPIEVTFRYDRSGRLHIEAVHVTSGTWAKTLIEREGGVDPEKVHLNNDILQRLTVA